tara:strand:+ start:2455 stop:2790 length:336 start_codon:yes stop_codon:yes gene_type:complete
VLEIGFYRLVRKQVNTGTAFVDTLQSYIKIQHQQQARQEEIINNLLQDLSLSEERLSSKDSIINSQYRVVETYYNEINKPKPKGIFPKVIKWLEDSWEKILLGMAAGALIF